MATEHNNDDEKATIPSSGAVFTFGRSRFANNEPNRFWIRDDPIKQVACGDDHTVLLTASGRIFTFGSNEYGQLGHGNNRPLTKPASVKGLKGHEVQSIACGRSHTLILLTSGQTLAFGQNNEGQLGVGDEKIRQVPTEILKLDRVKVVAFAAGAEHSAALTAKGQLYLWGSNGDGQLGLDDVNQTNTPISLDFQDSVRQVACGYYHTAFVTDRGELYTFGEGDYGKLGFTTNRNVFKPKLVSGIRGKIKKVACGGRHTIALTESGLIYTFGDGSQGQLGLGPSVLESNQPEIVEKLSKLKGWDIDCGENHNAVITENKQLYVWGDGQHGKLGVLNNFNNMFTPQHVTKFIKFDVWQASCGGCHTIVIAKASNKWEDREVARMKLTSRAVSFHGRGAKSEDENESDRSPDLSASARDRRRLKSLHETQSFNYGKNLPPLGQRNGFLATYPDKSNGKFDSFSRELGHFKAKSDSDSDDSGKYPTKGAKLYGNGQSTSSLKDDLASRFTIKPRKASTSDSDNSSSHPRSNNKAHLNLYNQQQHPKSASAINNNRRKISSGDSDSSAKSEPTAKSHNPQRLSNVNQQRYAVGGGRNGAATTKSDDSDSDREGLKRKPPPPYYSTSKSTVANRRANSRSNSPASDKSSDSERRNNKTTSSSRRNHSASTVTSSNGRKNSLSKGNNKESTRKSKFMDKFRSGNKGSIKKASGRSDSDTETTTSKDNSIKSKTCVIL